MNEQQYNMILNTRLSPNDEQLELSSEKMRLGFDDIAWVFEKSVTTLNFSYKTSKYRPFTVFKDGKLTRTAKKNFKAAKVLGSNGKPSRFFKTLVDCYDFSVLSADECVYMLSLIGADVSIFGGLRVGWNCLDDSIKVLATLIIAARWYPNTKIVRWSDLPFFQADGSNVTVGYTQHCQMNINTTVIDYCEMLAAQK